VLSQHCLVAWTNQDLILYHGTSDSSARNILSSGIDPTYFLPRTDFGLGFYTTTLRSQAEQWAGKQVNKVATVKGLTVRGALLEYQVPRHSLMALNLLAFVRPEDTHHDFWDLILHCRGGRPNHLLTAPGAIGNCYDAVFGPVAKDWRRKPFRCFPSLDQVSFHTSRALLLLKAPKLILLP